MRDGARTDCGKTPIGDLGALHKERHIFDRLPTVPTLFLLLSLSLAACAGAEGPTGPSGPTGPAGEAGPGTRIVLSGTINFPEVADSVLLTFGEPLPPEAGSLNDLPVMTYWISLDGVVWFNDVCDFVESEDRTFLIVLVTGANGWQYRIVVVY